MLQQALLAAGRPGTYIQMNVNYVCKYAVLQRNDDLPSRFKYEGPPRQDSPGFYELCTEDR